MPSFVQACIEIWENPSKHRGEVLRELELEGVLMYRFLEE